MRKPFICGNWKMNKNVKEAEAMITALKSKVANVDNVEMGICPTALCLTTVKEAAQGSDIVTGAENIYWKDSGAYTGEISAKMLADSGIEYTIVGHSERREIFGESDYEVNKKVLSALEHGVKPIVCVGETLEERKADQIEAKVNFQVDSALAGLSEEEAEDVVIAYEPIWAIGTGETASAEEANRVIGIIRDNIRKEYPEAADKIRIQYGGSVKPHNVEEIMAQSEIDGALVGGASLEADSFSEIILKTAEIYK
ncbi:triosephosphate isomerase [Halanaerobium saccharolyticum]|uniref:Triosephosphate isomerase n=1 Tax=Halanaerobium saccharolyticum TaxID=43595 RepID=A0A4R7YYL5_9FIRM|nr:triose-phosphate isomerase [Halanaerobium saccharolyticum]RAK08947.1 triosephosphate isomerase [Halanaerobium saccharolyticum]TDW02659.1 triosephosphate isomerase [Halanaerobium saccharolyticum]TDX60710.1 triosephosphate isomerase [Halanaerobium saccharolyticum]